MFWHLRAATVQKLKKFPDFSLTFYYWITIFVYIHFNLLFLQAIDIFPFILKPLSVFRRKRKKEFGRKHSQRNHWPQLLHVSGIIKCQIDHFACFAAYFSSFPKGNAFQCLEEHLWTINRKTEFPDFLLTLTISNISPDCLKNSLTFPWAWQPCIQSGLMRKCRLVYIRFPFIAPALNPTFWARNMSQFAGSWVYVVLKS